MTKEKIDKVELEKYRLTLAIVFIGFFLFVGIVAINIKADTITHKFKNPYFNCINTSSHYLTIENQEFNRKMSIKEEIKAIQEQIERDKENTTLARFIRNLESRIYAQLSRQLVENLFGETPSTEGILTLEGNTIEYSIDNGIITLKITDADGNITEIQLPIGDFSF